MCPHSVAVDLGEWCSQCLGPRDRRDPGTGIAAVACPLCKWKVAIPSFADYQGVTVTKFTCGQCGFEFH